MIQTEQLAPKTIIFHIQGPFHTQTAKELGLMVFQSHRMKFKTFVFNFSQGFPLDEQMSHQISIIGQGLHNKGCTWKIIPPPFSSGDQLILRTSLQHMSQAMLN